MSIDLLPTLLAALDGELPLAVELRERPHAHPEGSNAEHRTVATVAEALDSEGAERVAGTGLVARVGPVERPAVAVLAELDALPIEKR